MIPDHPQNEIWLFGFSRGACESKYRDSEPSVDGSDKYQMSCEL